jgi:transaldolase
MSGSPHIISLAANGFVEKDKKCSNISYILRFFYHFLLALHPPLKLFETIYKTRGKIMKITDLKIKLFTDGAEKASILAMAKKPYMAGFTTNPSLLKKAGVTQYEAYARDIVASIPDYPVSFEVFSDDIAEMEVQARQIATWGENVYVKLPVMNTKQQELFPLVRKLTDEGVKINLTAIFTRDQVDKAAKALKGGANGNISVFAGRLADTGYDPIPLVKHAVAAANDAGNAEVIWASTREVFNVIEADRLGVHIITAPMDILLKLEGLGADPFEMSLATIKTFVKDATESGLSL